MVAYCGPDTLSEEQKAHIAKLAASPKWEEVQNWTYRLKVPGGWIYRYGITRCEGLVFVPDQQ